MLARLLLAFIVLAVGPSLNWRGSILLLHSSLRHLLLRSLQPLFSFPADDTFGVEFFNKIGGKAGVELVPLLIMATLTGFEGL